MPDTNLVRSLTYLMDCFLAEYRDEKAVKDIDELDLRAQVEVRLAYIMYSELKIFTLIIIIIVSSNGVVRGNNLLRDMRYDEVLIKLVRVLYLEICSCYNRRFSGFIFLFVYLGAGRHVECKIERTVQRSLSWLSRKRFSCGFDRNVQITETDKTTFETIYIYYAERWSCL